MKDMRTEGQISLVFIATNKQHDLTALIFIRVFVAAQSGVEGNAIA